MGKICERKQASYQSTRVSADLTYEQDDIT